MSGMARLRRCASSRAILRMWSRTVTSGARSHISKVSHPLSRGARGHASGVTTPATSTAPGAATADGDRLRRLPFLEHRHRRRDPVSGLGVLRLAVDRRLPVQVLDQLLLRPYELHRAPP